MVYSQMLVIGLYVSGRIHSHDGGLRNNGRARSDLM
uniref:Uncharacterized protein n=1 Tax=Picea sitchensis TaxID=3332 RepID=D5A9Y0_PICSI|nr:unknown [Picea sitchensis]